MLQHYQSNLHYTFINAPTLPIKSSLYFINAPTLSIKSSLFIPVAVIMMTILAVIVTEMFSFAITKTPVAMTTEPIVPVMMPLFCQPMPIVV